MFFTFCRILGIQYLHLISLIVSRTPLCNTLLWASRITKIVKWESVGNNIGYFLSYGNDELANLPRQRKRPCSSIKTFKFFFKSSYFFEWNTRWIYRNHRFDAAWTSSVLIMPKLISETFFLFYFLLALFLILRYALIFLQTYEQAL